MSASVGCDRTTCPRQGAAGVRRLVMVVPTELCTERLVLRPFRADDIDEALAYRNDLEFSRYLPHIPQPFTRQHAEEFVARNMSEPWEQFATFAVAREGRLIGTVNLDADAAKQRAMIGFAIGRAHWGRGLATEAARAVVAWGFGAFDIVRIWATTDARNVRSRRVLEKLGMQLEGCLRSHGLARDGRADEVWYGLLREEWSAPG